ncbi:serine/threonine-protein kinase [Clavibacter michiganensis]|uniref:hypothetical protein n=1 Tax=Clavibacter michiganensis TaxID=28447 RepID=UPI000A3C4F30|nr:hypothetical protein [Clavibacter michiganensis]OUE13800.1 hypothetical protein CMMCAY01_12420 [Clavibacter michiganensis subsp. michiganensis]
MTTPGSPADALGRRLRDDPDAARALDALRRAAYGREDGDAPSVEVPVEVRLAAGVEVDALPAPLVALLVAEHRLVGEGRELLAADARATPRASDDVPTESEETADPRAHPLAPRRRRLRPGPVAAVLAGGLLVVGLGTASAAGLLADDDSWRSQDPTSTPGQPSTPDPRTGTPVPAFTAEPPAELREDLTDVETAQALRERADFLWDRVLLERPDAVRPDLPVERVLDGEEWVRQQAACLGESGVRVQVIGTGEDTRLGAHSADVAVEYACSVRFPTTPGGPLTDAALGWLHDYYVDFLIPCYASEGEPFEGEVPDREAFIASSRAGDPWQPYVETRDGALESRCPQAPVGLR